MRTLKSSLSGDHCKNWIYPQRTRHNEVQETSMKMMKEVLLVPTTCGRFIAFQVHKASSLCSWKECLLDYLSYNSWKPLVSFNPSERGRSYPAQSLLRCCQLDDEVVATKLQWKFRTWMKTIIWKFQWQVMCFRYFVVEGCIQKFSLSEGSSPLM